MATIKLLLPTILLLLLVACDSDTYYEQYETYGSIDSCDRLADEYNWIVSYFDPPDPDSDSPIILDFIELTEIEDTDYDLECVGEARVTDREKASIRLTYTIVEAGEPFDPFNADEGYMGVEIE